MRSRVVLCVLLVGCGPTTQPPPENAERPSVSLPDADRDGDLILDRCDRCPDEPEVYQTTDDDDGCPEGEDVIVIEESRHPSVRSVFFGEGSAELDEHWADAAELILSELTGDQAVEVACAGQALASEGEPLALSRRRAETVCAALAERAPEIRFVPRGMGSRSWSGDPIEQPDDPERERRVVVLEVSRAPLQWYQDPYAYFAWNDDHYAPAVGHPRARPEGPARCPGEVAHHAAEPHQE